MAVVAVHSSLVGNDSLPAFLRKAASNGARGVQLFFLVSAFTLCLSQNNRANKEAFPIRNFFIRRFFRIAPMYYIGICYYLLQDGIGPRYWLGDAVHISGLNIFSNFTFLHGFSPYWINSVVPGGWSIGVEMTFYLIFPLLFSRIKSTSHALYFFIASLFIRFIFERFFIHAHIIGSETLWYEYLYIYFPSQLPVFSLGILMFFLIYGTHKEDKLPGLALLLFSIIVIAQLAVGNNYLFPNQVLFAIGFLFLAMALSNYPSMLVVNPVIEFVGKISFSMYLVHFAVLHWLAHFHLINYFKNGTLDFISRFFIVTILSILVSTVLYKSVELPFQKIGRLIIAAIEKRHKNKFEVLEVEHTIIV